MLLCVYLSAVLVSGSTMILKVQLLVKDYFNGKVSCMIVLLVSDNDIYIYTE